jgi:DNA repair protein RadC
MTPHAHSDVEILAGIVPAPVAENLIREAGSLSTVFSLSVGELETVYRVTKKRAAAIVCAGEFAKRAMAQRTVDRPLDSPELIYSFLSPEMAHLAAEQVAVVTVDPRLRMIRRHVVAMGTCNDCPAHPREILRHVLIDAAYGFILAHNHPSGDPSPSRADESVTRRMIEASNIMQLKILDHIIIGKPAVGRCPYYSFRESGLIP